MKVIFFVEGFLVLKDKLLKKELFKTLSLENTLKL